METISGGKIDIITLLSINIIVEKKGLPLKQTNDKNPDRIFLPDDGETSLELPKIEFFIYHNGCSIAIQITICQATRGALAI